MTLLVVYMYSVQCVYNLRVQRVLLLHGMPFGSIVFSVISLI